MLDNNSFFSKILPIAIFLLVPIISWAKTQESTGPEKCKAIKPALQRLTCFDQLFKTPITIERRKKTTQYGRNKTPAIMQLAEHIEKQRNNETTGLLKEEIMEHEAVDQKRIILTTPAIGSHPPRPLLMISCINNITRLQIGLHQPVNKKRVNITLRLKTKLRLTDYSWRVTDDGLIIDAGRGIPSINLLKSMIGQKRILIHSDDISLEGLTFDITGFTHYVKSFRKACHW